jgi:Phytanoyl-CoA dioxygenase (PhyH)
MIRVNGLLEKSNPAESALRLRNRLSKEGYLFFPHFFDRNLIEKARRTAIRLCYELGIITEEFKRGETRLRKKVMTQPVAKTKIMAEEFGDKFSQKQIFTKTLQNKNLVCLLEKILGEKVCPHPDPISRWARTHFPQSIRRAIRVHQDFFYIRGVQEIYSVWIPMSHCPWHLGGLAVLSKSHRLGFLRHKSNGRAYLPRKHGCKWLSAEYEQGDVLIFSSTTVHGPLPNRTLDTPRLAYDFRFCKTSQLNKLGLTRP